MKFAYSLISFFLLAVSILHAQPLNVPVRAEKAILYNPENGAILYEKKANDPHNPASLTKVATALFLLDHVRPDMEKICVASKLALQVIHADIRQRDIFKYPPYILEHDGTMMGLAEGDAYPFEMLLHALILTSSNDAANVLAETSHGTIESFMEELNEYLLSKGIVHSRFQNPSGFYHPGQWTTAHEMAKLAGMGLQNSAFRKVISTRVYDKNPDEIITNYNRMMKEGKFSYEKVIGGKTGYLASAGYNLVIAAEDRGRTLVATLLGCKKSDHRYEDAISLFEAAFSEPQVTRCLFSEGAEFTREIPKREEPLKAYLKEKMEASYFPAEEGKMEGKIHWNTLQLPIRKGEEVGKLIVTDERGNQVTSCPVLAAEGIKGGFPVLKVILGVLLLAGVAFVAMARKRKRVR